MADTKETELAYFAGFFDGEGSVAIYTGKYVASLTNTDKRPLLRAQELWGGAVSMQPLSQREFAIRDLYRWQIYGHSARPFLEAIRPYCLLKCEQIDCYLEALAVMPNGRGLKRGPGAAEIIESCKVRLKQLKRAA